MAYIKSLDLNNGYSASYWRVTKIEANKNSPKLEVTVLGYKDKATRDAGASNVAMKQFEISSDGIDFNGNLFAQVYEALPSASGNLDGILNPQAPFFADAQSDE